MLAVARFAWKVDLQSDAKRILYAHRRERRSVGKQDAEVDRRPGRKGGFEEAEDCQR